MLFQKKKALRTLLNFGDLALLSLSQFYTFPQMFFKHIYRQELMRDLCIKHFFLMTIYIIEGLKVFLLTPNPHLAR